ncbi:MAG: hypothetical protein RMJ67_01950 [Elusimicrobiota bacterium]|nr:hypothetical protein [Endomicrobiia bacterium]MDW8165266.1 hypothetical protein [Elusimicrobiota bacterium]
MNINALVFMMISWILVIGLLIFCFLKILNKNIWTKKKDYN